MQTTISAGALLMRWRDLATSASTIPASSPSARRSQSRRCPMPLANAVFPYQKPQCGSAKVADYEPTARWLRYSEAHQSWQVSRHRNDSAGPSVYRQAFREMHHPQSLHGRRQARRLLRRSHTISTSPAPQSPDTDRFWPVRYQSQISSAVVNQTSLLARI